MPLDSDPIYCAEQIVIPPDLGDILKAYAKEVIRNEPEDIFEFSAKYFAQFVTSGKRHSAALAACPRMGPRPRSLHPHTPPLRCCDQRRAPGAPLGWPLPAPAAVAR